MKLEYLNVASPRLLTASLLLVAALVSLPPAQSVAVSATEPNTLSSEELAEGWILLFDGETLFGWEASGSADWKVADRAISAATSGGKPSLLATTTRFGNYVLRAEFRAPAETNSGMFLRTPLKPTDPARDCYEINIAPADNPFPTGSIVGRQRASGASVNADQWNAFEIKVDGGEVVVRLNGQQMAKYDDPQPLAVGRIGLQHNSGAVSFRNIKLKPIGLDSIFNGKNLDGWKVREGEKSEFKVTDEGTLQVLDGPGTIESQRQFGDFVLQLEAFSGGDGLNSGVFFRSIPGQRWNGYECQIQNGFKDGDRSKPRDCGTGGFYRRQNARRIVANDHEWFQITLVADGKHMATWVNGFQVSDWSDPRPPHENPRQGSRTEPGTLQIQGHDPTTNLSFRKLRAAEVEMPQAIDEDAASD